MPSLYTRSASLTCEFCHQTKDTEQHYLLCVPRPAWPDWMGEREAAQRERNKNRPSGATLVIEAPSAPPEPHGGLCTCGWESQAGTYTQRVNALKAHMRFSKTHRVPANA